MVGVFKVIGLLLSANRYETVREIQIAGSSFFGKLDRDFVGISHDI